ncbi:AI-2E family transporter [Sinobaca sp. H24]|uniref:AI-2E family transporter n=1 Tax=Sinobaca sp. H24 TaxID=2923376 RepID=UPI0027E325A2|nr:AI-2E family transporter [Sinobaca sp. H24]
MSSFLTKKNMIRFLSVLILIVALIFILPVSGPIILALLTALALSPLVRLLNEKAKWRRSIAVTVVFILFLISLGIAGYLIITQVVTQAILFVENLPGYIAEVNRSWNDMQISIENTYERMNLPPDVINEINAQVTDMLNNFRDIFTDGRF